MGSNIGISERTGEERQARGSGGKTKVAEAPDSLMVRVVVTDMNFKTILQIRSEFDWKKLCLLQYLI